MFCSRKKTLSIFLAGIFLATGLLGGSTATDVKWGNTTFEVSNTEDESLAAIAGYASYQVTWFDGFTLYKRAVDSDEKYIYGAIASLFDDNFDAGKLGNVTRTFDYTDPNNVSWQTEELEYDYNDDSQFGDGELIYRVKVGNVTNDPDQGNYNFVLVVDNGIESVGWVDDVSLEEEGNITNLLQNPGFEDGSGNSQPHWNMGVRYSNLTSAPSSDGYVITDNNYAHTGTKSMRYTINNTDNATDVHGYVYQTVAAKSKTKYNLTAWIGNKQKKEGTFKLVVDQSDSKHTIIASSYQTFDKIGSGWFQCSITIPSTKATVAYLTVTIEYYAGSNAREGQDFALFMANT